MQQIREIRHKAVICCLIWPLDITVTFVLFTVVGAFIILAPRSTLLHTVQALLFFFFQAVKQKLMYFKINQFICYKYKKVELGFIFQGILCFNLQDVIGY